MSELGKESSKTSGSESMSLDFETSDDVDSVEIISGSSSGSSSNVFCPPAQQIHSPMRSPFSAKRKARRTSTADSCPICLSEIVDHTVLSECAHVFCYSCILEWLKMKPQCPLCKRVPRSFKHSIHVVGNEKPTWSSDGIIVNVKNLLANLEMEYILANTSYSADVERHAVVEVINQIGKEQRIIRSMTFNAFGREAIYNSALTGLEDDLHSYEHLLNMFPIASRRQIFNEPAFRRVLYLRNLSPRSIVPPRFGIVFNLEYIKEHEKEVRLQLLPYIVREVSALTRNECVDISDTVEKIFDYLLNKSNRLKVVSFLNERGIRHPHQFLNNLAHFASTGQSLMVYDQNSEYVPRSTNHILSHFAGNNDDVLFVNSVVNNDVQVVGESSRGLRRNLQMDNFQPIDRISQRIAELQSRRHRTSGQFFYLREGVAQAISRLRNRQRNEGNPSNAVVDLSSSDSDSDEIEQVAEGYNTNNLSVIPQQYDNYVYTPSTDAWRRDLGQNAQPKRVRRTLDDQ